MKTLNYIFKIFSFFIFIVLIIILILYFLNFSFRYLHEDSYLSFRDEVRVFRAKYLRPSHKYRFLEIHPDYLEVDVRSILRISSLKDIKSARNNLINLIWNKEELPNDILPTKINYNIYDPIFSKIKTIRSNKSKKLVNTINEFIYENELGFRSRSLHMQPIKPNGSLIIYYEGNTGLFYRNSRVLNKFLDEGYEILAFSMWINDQRPEIKVPGAGLIKFMDHSYLQFIKNPLSIYFNPIVAGINQLTKKRSYNNII